MFGKVPSDHLVQQFGRALDDWRPNYTITRVGSDPSLRKVVRGSELGAWNEGNYLVIDELFGRIVLLQH